MHDSDQSDFTKTVKEIKNAEDEYDNRIVMAKQKAEDIIKKARESAVQERMAKNDEITSFKDKRLKEGSKEIEAKIDEIVGTAKEEAKKINKKKLDSTGVSKLAKEFLSSI